ncbi:MAG: hypothetical protein BYD32DRAFT_461677 [Podila humilis]|nr:MAG: hypothetical protein BYD32DRAFT_461677 [Podila humilis]
MPKAVHLNGLSSSSPHHHHHHYHHYHHYHHKAHHHKAHHYNHQAHHHQAHHHQAHHHQAHNHHQVHRHKAHHHQVHHHNHHDNYDRASIPTVFNDIVYYKLLHHYLDNPNNYNLNNHTDPDNNNDNIDDTNNNPSCYYNYNYYYHPNNSCTDYNNRSSFTHNLATPTGIKTTDDGGLSKPTVIGIGVTAAVIVGFVFTVMAYKTRHRRHKALNQDDLFDHLPIESPKPPPPPMGNIHHHHHETDNLYNNSDYNQHNYHQGHQDHGYDHHGDHNNYDHHHDGDQGTSQHNPGDISQQTPSGNQGFGGGNGGQGGNQGFSGGNQGFGGNQGGGLDQLGSTQGPTHTGFNGGHGHHGFNGHHHHGIDSNSGPSGQGQGFGNGPSGSGSQGFGNGPSGAQPQGFTPTNQPFGPGPSQPTGNIGGTGVGGGMGVNTGVNLGHVVSTMPPPPPTPVLNLKKPPLAPRPDSTILTSPTFTAPSGLDYRTSISSVASSGILQPWEEPHNTTNMNMTGYSPPGRQNLLQQVQAAHYNQDLNYVRPPPANPPRVMVSPTIATIPPPADTKPVVRAPQDRTSSEAVGAITTTGNVSGLNTFDRRHPQLQGDGHHESIF